VVAVYLGTIIYFKTFSGLGLVIGWTVWTAVYVIVLEVIDIFIRTKQKSKHFYPILILLLMLPLFIAFLLIVFYVCFSKVLCP
jgi:hypothetical protein